MMQTPDSSATLEALLARMALQLAGMHWMVVIGKHGVPLAAWPLAVPALPQVERIAAMGVALGSLGQRVAHELRSGDLHYLVVAGSEALTLVIALSAEYQLLVHCNSDTASPTILAEVRRVAGPLAQALGITVPVA